MCYFSELLNYYQLHHIPGNEHCLSELESFRCHANTNQNISEVARICKSIKKLRFDNIDYSYTNVSGIIKLIEVQENLINISFMYHTTFTLRNKSFNKSLEESLIKHTDTIQYMGINWKPITKFLSYFVN